MATDTVGEFEFISTPWSRWLQGREAGGAGFGEPDVSRSPKPGQAHGLRQASLNPRALAMESLPFFRLFAPAGFVHHRRDATRDDARRDLFGDIEGDDKRQRLHSALGDTPPVPAELQAV